MPRPPIFSTGPPALQAQWDTVSPQFLLALESLVQAHIAELGGEDRSSTYIGQEAKSSDQCFEMQLVSVPKDATASEDQIVEQSATAASEGRTIRISENEHIIQTIEEGEKEIQEGESEQPPSGEHTRGYDVDDPFEQSKSNRNRMCGSISSSPGLFENMRGSVTGPDSAEAGWDLHEYDVSDFYHEAGYFQVIARSGIFGHVTLLVIAANAAYMGIDAELNTATTFSDTDWWFLVCEYFFVVFFTLEWTVRFGAFAVKYDCLKDAWFKFDSALLMVIWFETFVLPSLLAIFDGIPVSSIKLFRLFRLARLVRIMRAFPELVTMIQGMLAATRAVGSAMVLLVIAIYAWGITMNTLLKDDETVKKYWSTIPASMMTLMANGTLGDSIGTILRLIQHNGPALVLLILFIVFSALTVLNMLVGVLCEVVAEVAAAEHSNAVMIKLKGSLLVMLRRIDEDGSGFIDKNELMGIMRDANALAVMQDLNISAKNFIEMIDMHYASNDTLTIPFIMQLLVENQGQRATTIQDLRAFNEFNRWSMKQDMIAMQKELNSISQTTQLMGRSMSSMNLAAREEKKR